MPKSMKNMVLLAKQEVTTGVDPIPTPAANSMLVRAMTPSIITADFVERNNLRGFKGNFGSLAVGVHRMFEFEVELASSGTAGAAPKWGPLLMACGFSQTLVALASAAYQPISVGDTTVTLYGYLDELLFKMTACKGTVSFELNSKAIPVMKFKFLGEYSAATDTPFPTGMDFTGFQQPLTVGKVNTPTFSFFGFPAIAQSLSFDVANSLVYRDLINLSGPFSSDRKPTGSATIELPTAAAANFGEIARLGTMGALNLVHGTAAGQIVQVAMPKLQLTSAPTISNDNEIAMLAVGFAINPNLGNDEIVITAR